eukprot:scaffold109065_cov75-Phaeocystis_antarctica.AAC.11
MQRGKRGCAICVIITARTHFASPIYTTYTQSDSAPMPRDHPASCVPVSSAAISQVTPPSANASPHAIVRRR